MQLPASSIPVSRKTGISPLLYEVRPFPFPPLGFHFHPNFIGDTPLHRIHTPDPAMAPLLVTPEDSCDGDGCFNEHFLRSLRIQPDPAGSPAKSRKRVRFSFERRCLEPAERFYTPQDIEAKWFTGDELVDIKERAKGQSAAIRRAGPPEACSLTMAYRKTSLMLAGDFQALVKLPTTSPDQDLRHWCAHNDGRRGLERFASREYCCLRRADITKTREVALAEQRRQRECGQFDEELLAKLSREASRRARTFALFVGEADSKQTRPLENARKAPPRKRSRIEIRHESPAAIAAAC